MDLSSIIISLTAVLVVIGPIVYFQRTQRKERAKVKLQLDSLGQAHNLTFSFQELWGSGYAIGLDTSKRILFYSPNLHEREEYRLIDLSEVANCTTCNEYKDANANRVIEQVNLDLTFKGGRSTQRLLFYNKDQNLHFTNELLLAEKWKGLICANR